MTELFLFFAVILLAFILRSIGKVSDAIGTQTVSIRTHLGEIEERLQGIEERIRDNFMTNDEREREAARREAY